MNKRTMVIVGAGKRLSYYIAKQFGNHDFRLILIARHKENLKIVADKLASQGIEVYTFIGDASKATSLRQLFSEIEQQFGAIDTMLYNVAIREAKSPTELCAEELTVNYRTEVSNALLCVQQILPDMLRQKSGTILFTGGGFALHPMAEYGGVSINKAALRALALTLHQELKSNGVFVGIVTIMGSIVEGTHYSPELIAKKYWEIYKERNKCEIIY